MALARHSGASPLPRPTAHELTLNGRSGGGGSGLARRAGRRRIMAARAPHGVNQPPKIIVKKIYIEGHGGHHGGAWKVAYADFVTAMMAFFLLLWLLGATNEKQRKALADYFSPTLVELKQNSAGSN